MATMASAAFEHPKIDWEAADLYQKFERFRSHVDFVFAGPLSELEPKQRAGWLGTWIGEQGREINRTLNWADDGEKQDPVKVLNKIAGYIRPRKNKRIARHCFKQRKQGATEGFDHFVKDLKLLLMDCEYADSDDMLIDAIIAGVRETRVQERLLDKGEELTLAKAIEIPQQFEMSQKQMLIVIEEDLQVSSVSTRSKLTVYNKKPQSYAQPKPIQQKQAAGNQNKCLKCGKPPQHPWNQGKCPAQGSTCSYCHKLNHWAAVCRSHALSSVSVESAEEDPQQDEEILDISLTQEDTPVAIVADDKWVVSICVLSREVRFRIDTGAKCNTLTLDCYQLLNHQGELKCSNRILRSYSNHRLRPVAAVDLSLTYKDRETKAELEIINIAQENVLSGATAEALGLIVRLNSLQDGINRCKVSTANAAQKPNVPVGLRDFPELARTTGTLPGEYTIKIDPDAKGVVHPVRRQPAALREKIQDKLTEMLRDSTPEAGSLGCVSMLNFVSVSEQKYSELQEHSDEELGLLQQIIQQGWPSRRREVPILVQPYWDSRSQLTVCDGIVFKGLRIVVAPTMRAHMLKLIHQSHLGMVKSKQRAREVLYWLGMSAEIENMIRNCCKCAEIQNRLPREPLKPTETPELPFEEVASDLFEFEGKHYIILVDYYSKYIEVDELKDLRSLSTIGALKAQFSRHGIPSILRTDGGLQYSSEEFKEFCKSYGVLHKTSSPQTPHSNGESERGVQTVKRLWSKASDKHLALLDYRTTPLESVGLSPAQLLMGRRPRNKLPAARVLLAPMA
ncbi:Transposon Ty3-G Gag-Pol poly [Xyrichtys novacula]|uniref:Gypsy retrotransposon integrase-like protein 1 n=1 Tax=Xyrichtys novacula TaxID=13765 RepID=A0AAV1G043_XYRNO|nr:Transposon Ty3-G Gag-Pol poly [Xyrichtys novacula]